MLTLTQKGNYWLIILFSFGVVVGCSKNHSSHHVDPVLYQVEDYAADIQIPSKAWDILEYKSEEDINGTIKTNVNLNFSEITVKIVESTPGVIKNKSVEIKLPKGGGEIDLADYVLDEQGSFLVSFDYELFNDSLDQKILFVSNAKKRKIDNKIWGSGCRHFFDITRQMKGKEIKVNTTRGRYVSVLGGHFLFSSLKGSRIYVSRVSFTDSRYKTLFCDKEHYGKSDDQKFK